jgi:hypothetical protein
MEVIKGMQPNGDSYSWGKILDPKKGKEYKCKITRDGDTLKMKASFLPFLQIRPFVNGWEGSPLRSMTRLFSTVTRNRHKSKQSMGHFSFFSPKPFFSTTTVI